MVALPEEYPWSSYGFNALGLPSALLKQHATYQALGDDGPTRCGAYASLVSEAIDVEETAEIRSYLRQGKAWGATGSRPTSKHCMIG